MTSVFVCYRPDLDGWDESPRLETCTFYGTAEDAEEACAAVNKLLDDRHVFGTSLSRYIICEIQLRQFPDNKAITL